MRIFDHALISQEIHKCYYIGFNFNCQHEHPGKQIPNFLIFPAHNTRYFCIFRVC